MDFIGRVTGIGDLHRHGGMACGLFHLDAVGIPADGRGAAVLSAQVGAEGNGISGQALLAGDLDFSSLTPYCLHGSIISLLITLPQLLPVPLPYLEQKQLP